jgi:hypothetical protein
MLAGTLTISYADGREEQHRFNQALLRLGRNEDNDVQVDDPLVSGVHCELFADANGYRIRDLNSTNGTFVDGQRLQPSASMAFGADSVIELGDAQIRIAWQAPDAADDALLNTLLDKTATAATPPPVPPGGPPLGLSIVPPRQTVYPGATVTAMIIVVNNGSTTDQISIDVDGLPMSWINVRPAQHRLAPGAQASSQLSITPPRAATTLPGEYPVTIVAYPAASGVSATQVPTRLEVFSFIDCRIALDPTNQASWYRGLFVIEIENLGNQQATFLIQGFDEEGALEFDIADPEIRLGPGVRDSIELDVRLRAGRVFANPRIYDFTISVEPVGSSASPRHVRGELIQNPPFPLWLVPAVLLVLLLMGGLWLWNALGVGGPDGPVAPLPSPSLPIAAVATPDATGTVAAILMTQEALAATQAAGFTQTALAAGQSNVETQTASANEVAATQTMAALNTSATAAVLETVLAATSAALGGSATAAAASLAETQTAFAQTLATQTEQALALSQTQTVEAIAATQTALAVPTPTTVPATATPLPTPTTVPATTTPLPIPPTAPPADLLQVSFATLDGQPVETRQVLDGDEYLAQGLSFCVFALGENGLAANPAVTDTAQLISDCPLETLVAEVPTLEEFLNRLPPERAAPVIYPPTVDVIQAPGHVLAVEPTEQQAIAEATLALITFQREVSEATLTLWQPEQQSSEFLLIAYDASNQVTGRTQMGLISGPGEVQLSVSGLGEPIQRLVVLPLSDSGGPLFINRIEGRLTSR